MGAAAGGNLTTAQQDAIGYVGGGILAICLIPQVAKVLMTRSARDISISWSILYSIGLTLSLAYLILKDAIAAWIPIIFEIAGCLVVLCLKLFYERTAAGRRYSAAKQQQALELPLQDSPTAGQHSSHAGAGLSSPRSLAALGAAAAAAVGSSGDISWRGRAVLGQHLESPAGLTVPMIDCSTHGGSRHGSVHGGSMHDGSRPSSRAQHCADDAAGLQDKQQQQQYGDMLKVKCTGTSLGSCSNSSLSLPQEASRGMAVSGAGSGAAATAIEQQQQQQQQAPLEPLFAPTWALRPVAPVVHAAGAKPSPP